MKRGGSHRASPIIRILDRNGKGNTKNSEAVAKAMIPQGAWRRMFNEFHSNREQAVTQAAFSHQWRSLQTGAGESLRPAHVDHVLS